MQRKGNPEDERQSGVGNEKDVYNSGGDYARREKTKTPAQRVQEKKKKNEWKRKNSAEAPRGKKITRRIHKKTGPETQGRRYAVKAEMWRADTRARLMSGLRKGRSKGVLHVCVKTTKSRGITSSGNQSCRLPPESKGGKRS